VVSIPHVFVKGGIHLTSIFKKHISIILIIIIIVIILIPNVFSINNKKSGNYYNPTIAIDVNNNIYIVYQLHKESTKNGKICLSKIHNTEPLEIEEYEITDCYTGNSRPEICLNNLNIILISYSNYYQGEADIYISIYDSTNKSWNRDIQITNNINKDEAWSSIVSKDSDGNFHIIWQQLNDWGLFYSKVDSYGDILINKKNLTTEHPVSPLDIILDSEGNLNILYENGEKKFFKISENGLIIADPVSFDKVSIINSQPLISDNNSNMFYLGDNGIADSHNDVHIITSNSASLLYTKLNHTGAKLIENKTIATHDKKKNYDHGPAIFDPKVAIDSEDNIHITWYINDGGSNFSIWYEKIDPNGTVLIPAMKIAPEDEKGKDSTPSFELIPLIMVVVVAAAVMRKRR